MLGRFQLFSPAVFFPDNMLISGKTTIRPQNDCWQVHRTTHNCLDASKFQRFLQPEKSVFQRKVGIPGTYYARQRAENTAKASQLRSPPRVQVTLESLGTHSYAALPNRGDWQAGQTYTRSCAGTQGTAGLTFLVTKFGSCP